MKRNEKFSSDVLTINKLRHHAKTNSAELIEDGGETEDESPPGDVMEIHNCAVCWNCGDSGHVYKECLRDRTIFCYGCGLKGMYKPTCSKCSISVNALKGVSRQKRGHSLNRIMK